jgi:hypothetical protein
LSETPELYEEFPEAQILLIEPLAEFEPFLRKFARGTKAQYVLAAAGVAPGTATLNVHPDRWFELSERGGGGPLVDGVPREVPIVTIDGVCAEKGSRGRTLLR